MGPPPWKGAGQNDLPMPGAVNDGSLDMGHDVKQGAYGIERGGKAGNDLCCSDLA